MNIEYYQLDSTNKKNETQYLKELQSKEYLIIGIEITDIDFTQYVHFNIDPQHEYNSSSITSLEFVFKYKESIQKIIHTFNNAIFITIKPDLDSIGAMAILAMIVNNDLNITGDLVLRLKAIIKSDKHGRHNWKKHNKEDVLKFSSYSTYGLPVALLTMVADRKMNIDNKVNGVIQYFKTGHFNKIKTYTKKAKQKLKNANKETKVNIIISEKLVYVTSNYRGAIGLGYNYAPIVLGQNKHYLFGKDNALIGTKYTVAQFNNSFIDINKIKTELNKLDSGWGGSECIIGSNQTKSCDLKYDVILNIIKKYLK